MLKERTGVLRGTYADKAYCSFGLSHNQPDAGTWSGGVRETVRQRRPTTRPGQLENWFLTILRNIHLDFVRRSERKYGISLDMPICGMEGLTVADTLADGREPALLDRLEQQETGERVQTALKLLSPALRSVVVLVDMEGLRYEEAAKILDCPLNTVRSRIVRARPP